MSIMVERKNRPLFSVSGYPFFCALINNIRPQTVDPPACDPKFGHQGIFNRFGMFRSITQPRGNRFLLMPFYAADAPDPRTFGDHREAFRDLTVSRAPAVENRAPRLRKSFTAGRTFIALTAGAGVTGFYNTASALLYLFIIGTDGIRTEIAGLRKFGHGSLLSAAILSYIER
jgi:hypothetical protein